MIKTNAYSAGQKKFFEGPSTMLYRTERYLANQELQREMAEEMDLAITIAIQNMRLKQKRMEAARNRNKMTIRDRISHNDQSVLHRFFIGNTPVIVYGTRHVNQRIAERSVDKAFILESLEECHRHMDGTLIDRYERYTTNQENRGFEFAIRNHKRNVSVTGAVYADASVAKIVLTTVLNHSNFYQKDWVEPIDIY